MIHITSGDIFESKAQVITNPVNCVGLATTTVAQEYRKRFLEMYLEYKYKCFRRDVKLGEPYLYRDDYIQILVFPTKGHWAHMESLVDIEAGLVHLKKHYREWGIRSIALPKLGSGLGNLPWEDVLCLIAKHFANVEDLEVSVYE